MKKTGRINPITHEEILEAELFDLKTNKTWEELTLDDKANFCSYAKIAFLNKDNESFVKGLWDELCWDIKRYQL